MTLQLCLQSVHLLSFLFLSFSLSNSLSLSLSLFLSLSHPLYYTLIFSFTKTLCISLSLIISSFSCFKQSFFLSFPFSHSVISMSISLLPVCFSIFLYVCVPVCLSIYLSFSLSFCCLVSFSSLQNRKSMIWEKRQISIRCLFESFIAIMVSERPSRWSNGRLIMERSRV